MQFSIERGKDSIQEIELGEHTNHDGEVENGQISDNYNNDTHEILNKNQNQQTHKIKKHLIFYLILSFISLAIVCGLLYFYFFYQNGKKKLIYNGDLVEECPIDTYMLNNSTCVDSCKDDLYYRGRECVRDCQNQDYKIDNYCIISNCFQNNGDYKNKSRNRSLLSNKNFENKGFYDFQTKQCVQSCSSDQYQLFGEFCMGQICSKKEIYAIISQYLEKRQNNTIPIKSYNKTAQQFQNFVEDELIITPDKKNKVCKLGCDSKDQKFLIFNKNINEYECTDFCPRNYLFYMKSDQHLCYEKCPQNTYLSAFSNECVDSCQDLFISEDKCVKSCNKNQLKEGMRCVDVCSQDRPYIYQSNQCVSSCLIDLKTSFVLNKKCVRECPRDYFLKPIREQQNSFECVKQCDLLSSKENICAEICEDDEVEIVENQMKKCFKKMICSDQYQFYIPEEGCKNNCSTKYPIKFKQQCIKTCFENFYLYNGECLNFCPYTAPYSYNGKCFQSCGQGLFQYLNQCYSTCPDNLYNNTSDYTCVKDCQEFFELSEHTCYSKCPPKFQYNIKNECLRSCTEKQYVYIDSKYNYNCVDNCPKSTYLTPQGRCVSECPSNLFTDIQMKKCVEKCPTIYDEKRVCKSICETNDRYIAGREVCYKECPQSYFKEEDSNECVEICNHFNYKAKEGENKCVPNCQIVQQYQLDKQCVEECPQFLYNNVCVEECPKQNPYSEIKQCVSYCSQQKVLYKSQCLDKCPQNLFYVQETKKCEEDCPKGQFVDVQEQICTKSCDKLLLDNKYCLSSCPSNSVNKDKVCQSHNQNVPGFYLNENGEIINTCDFDQGYYTEKRVCKKCKGGEQCKKCSLLYGICIECKQSFSLYNNECVKDCPVGYIDKTGICIHDNSFLKENLFFREYKDSQYLNQNQTMKYSIIQDNNYIKSLGDDIKGNDNDFNKYLFTVIVHLHDLNSTYLDFYSYTLNHGTNEEQQNALDNLKFAVMDQGISIITVQATELLFFDKQFDLIINELIPSIGYFKCNIVFTGIGTASNSILKSVSQKLYKQQEENSRHIFGNYLIDLQRNFTYEQMIRELSREQLEEFKNFAQTDQEFEENINVTCSILDKYLLIADVTYINQDIKSRFISMNDVFANSIMMSKCMRKNVKPKGVLIDFYRNKEDEKQTKPQFNNDEYTSEKRKIVIYKYISIDMIQEVSQWVNNATLE